MNGSEHKEAYSHMVLDSSHLKQEYKNVQQGFPLLLVRYVFGDLLFSGFVSFEQTRDWTHSFPEISLEETREGLSSPRRHNKPAIEQSLLFPVSRTTGLVYLFPLKQI